MRLRPLRCLAVLLLTCTSALLLAADAPQRQAPPAQQRHPLDPLTDVEINAAASVLRASPQFPAGALFATIVLKEPPKRDVLSHSPGGATVRQAFAVILDSKRNRTVEAVVDLERSRIVSWRDVKGVQPVVLEAELETLVRVVKGDARWQDAMRKRGVSDFEDVQIDYWAVGQVASRFRGDVSFVRCPTSRASSRR